MTQEVAVKQTKTKVMPVSPGRPKGIPNKNTAEVKEMILMALSNAGGVDYLTRQADENPKAFLSLIGRVLPLQVTGANNGPLQVVFTQQDISL